MVVSEQKQNIFGLFLIIAMLFASLPANAFVPSDPFLKTQGYLKSIGAEQAWEITTGSEEIVVAILDAGFDLDHVELDQQYWSNEAEKAGNKKDDDKNGYEDDVNGWDFVGSDPDPSPDTSNPLSDTVISHGTVIAGIIGAESDNNTGIAGINHNISLMPLRVLNENGSGSTKDIREAIEYAVNNGADVINLSFTFNTPDERLQETIAWAHEQGVVIVAAVGNGGLDTDETPVYPACYDNLLGKNVVIGVASTDSFGQKAEFSNYGTNCTDITAPGTNVFGTVYNDDSTLLLSTQYGGPWEGTSISAPIVAGAAALLLAEYPTLSPDQVRLALTLSASPLAEASEVARKKLGAGQLNLTRALVLGSAFLNPTGPIQTRGPSQPLVVAEGAGFEPMVHVADRNGVIKHAFLAYDENFRGGVRLAMADVTGDGVPEVITGAGASGGPHIRIFSLEGELVSQFFAFDPSDRNGVYVQAADTTGDGIAEIIVWQRKHGGSVRVFDRQGRLVGALMPFEDDAKEIDVTPVQFDDDEAYELAFLLSAGVNSRVRVLESDGKYLTEFPVLNSGTHLWLSAGDTNSNGQDELLISNGIGSDPIVSVYASDGMFLKNFFAYAEEFRGGVFVRVMDLNLDGTQEIVTAPQQNGGPHIRIFDTEGHPTGGFFAFNKLHRSGASLGVSR